MSENTNRRPRLAVPTFLTQPSTVDLLLAVLVEYGRGTERTNPMGAALGTTVDGIVAELVDGKYGTGLDPRRARGDQGVTAIRSGTDG